MTGVGYDDNTVGRTEIELSSFTNCETENSRRGYGRENSTDTIVSRNVQRTNLRACIERSCTPMKVGMVIIIVIIIIGLGLLIMQMERNHKGM